MSSDSDDDCYGKIAKKLQSMKSDYKEDKINSKNLLKDSLGTVNEDLTTDKDELHVRALLKQGDIDIGDTKEVSLDSIIEQNTHKRKTRGRPKKTIEDVSYVPDEPVRRGTRRSSKRVACQEKQPTEAEVSSRERASNTQNSSRSPRRGRGRGRGGDRERGRNRGRRRACTNHSLSDFLFISYNIGNTDHYTDNSEQQDLFSANTAKPDDVFIVDDDLNDSLDENEEISIKVYWQSSEFFKFTIRRYQKFTEIYEFFTKKTNVTKEKLLFTYNDKMLNVDDTPDTIKYNIGKFIDGGIVNQSLSPLKKKAKHEVNSGIKLKFQCQNVKKPYETFIEANDKLSLAFMRCAEHFEKPIEKLKFYFDGDLISGKNTAKDLELEGGECIDVVIIS